MTRHKNIPPIIESREDELRDPGIESTVQIAGHPLHPALVTFPIALLVSAFLTDLGYWLTTDPFWARASVWLLGVGIASGLIAAATGMIDFLRIERVRARSAGWIHMALNVAALGLSLINWLPRLGDATGPIVPWGLAASTVVAALLGASGWFGGELAYRHKVGVIGDHDRSVP
jgi:uncharacterized membrane protein